jgi:hypothetical protein
MLQGAILNLAKPREESDNKEPESLVDEAFKVKKKVPDSAKPEKYGWTGIRAADDVVRLCRGHISPVPQ